MWCQQLWPQNQETCFTVPVSVVMWRRGLGYLGPWSREKKKKKRKGVTPTSQAVGGATVMLTGGRAGGSETNLSLSQMPMRGSSQKQTKTPIDSNVVMSRGKGGGGGRGGEREEKGDGRGLDSGW